MCEKHQDQDNVSQSGGNRAGDNGGVEVNSSDQPRGSDVIYETAHEEPTHYGDAKDWPLT